MSQENWDYCYAFGAANFIFAGSRNLDSLKKFFKNLFLKAGITNERTKNIVRHVGWSTLYKGGSVLASFLLVPLTIDYLDNENYGIWLTLSSFISWFSFFDIGLGHGLRNKFAEAKAKGQKELAQAYISCAYYTIGFISVGLILLFLIANNFIDWSAVFNTSKELRDDLNLLMPIVFGFFGLQLVVKLITTIYTADQYHSIQSKIEFITRALSLIAIWLLTKTDESSLIVYGGIFSALPVIILLTFNFLAFSTTYRNYKPSFALFKLKYLKDITGIGLSFFFIQISLLVLFSTDNFIISRLFGPADVVPYNVSHKYFSIVTMGYTILVTPYWSSITEANANNDLKWIKESVGNIQKLWLLIPLLLILMVLLADWFYGIWVGDAVSVPIQLSISMAFFALLMTFQAIYVLFLNGVGKVRLQLYLSIFSIIINIPLSIFLSENMGLGLSGIILATSFSILVASVLWPIQYHKIINKKATGIWNK